MGKKNFPKCSMLLNAPWSIIQVLVWNLRSSPVPIAYGTKTSFSCMQAVSLITMPVTWTALKQADASGLRSSMTTSSTASKRTGYGNGFLDINDTNSTGNTLSYASSRSQLDVAPHDPPSSSGRSSRRATLLGPAGHAPGASVSRSQARTLELEIEVAAMENRVRHAISMLPSKSPNKGDEAQNT